MANKPRLLDLFCGAGGAAIGYQRAGFDVTGVDIRPQKSYPFRFAHADALTFLRAYGDDYDAFHASPPCQKWTKMQRWNNNADAHPDWIGAIREELLRTGKPFVIENVEGAPLQNPILLCGVMFGLKVYRHRLFESNILLMQMPHPQHPERMPSIGRGVSPGGYVSVGNGGIRGVKNAHEVRSKAMGINWMSRRELSEAIPPAYTEFIGKQLLEAIAELGD